MAMKREDLELADGQRQPKHSTGSGGAEWHERRARVRESRTFKHEALAAALGSLKRWPFKA